MAAVYRDRIPREKALEILARGGKLSQAGYLRCMVRYFSDGAVIGGKAFVEEAFAAFRDRFGPKRKDGARPLRGLAGERRIGCSTSGGSGPVSSAELSRTSLGPVPRMKM